MSVVTVVVRGPSVCVSVTLVHPVNAVGWNEMPFGRDTHTVPSNIMLDWALVPHWMGEILVLKPP